MGFGRARGRAGRWSMLILLQILFGIQQCVLKTGGLQEEEKVFLFVPHYIRVTVVFLPFM